MEQKRKLQLVLLLSWATYMVAYLCRVNISTALDKLSAGLTVSTEYLGVASSIYFVTYAIGQLVNGAIGDRVNPYRFLMLALTMTGTINVVLALQHSGSVFLLLWGLNGFCQSMFWSTLLRLLAAYSLPEQRKNITTIMSTCSVTGYLLSWVVLSSLFQPCTFLPYFLVPGVIALLLMLAWYAMSREMPFTAATEERRSAPPLPRIAREFMRDKLFFVCALCLTVGAIQEGAVFWLPKIFTSVLELGSGSLLLLVLIPFAKLAGVFMARAMLGVFHDNVRRSITAMLAVSCIITGAMLAAGNRTSVVTVLLIAALIAVINASNWYMISYLPMYFAKRNIVSTLVGTFDFSTYVGASIMSGVLGALLSRFGWIALPACWMALTVLGLALSLVGARVFPTVPPEQYE